MTIKQTIIRSFVFTALVGVLSVSFTAGFYSPTASADPASTKVTCKDGKKVTAKIDDAAPDNRLNDKDFKIACKNNGGYEAPATPSTPTTPTDGSEDGEPKGDCGGAETAIIKCDADNSGDIKTNGIWALLLMTINIMTAGVGIAAVGGIIYGSILYTTSGDDESRVKKSKEVIQNVIIGLIAYVAMYALLQFIIPGGIFA